MIKTFKEWCGEKGIKIEEVSTNLLPTAYKVWGTECYHEAKELKAENAALRERLNITKMALEYACLETLQSNEQYLEELKEKVNKYIEQAEDVFNSEKNGISFTFAEARLAELKGEEK